MQNVKIYKDFDTQKDSFGKFLFSLRREITKDELSKLFELIFSIYHLRRVTGEDELEAEEDESPGFGQMESGVANPPLPVEFSQNFRSNDEAVAKFFELLRKIGPYMNTQKRKGEEGTEISKYRSWKWMHLEDALIKLKLLVSSVPKRTFSDFIQSVLPDRSSDSVYRALYRKDEDTYHSTVGDVARFFQPVISIMNEER